MALLDAYDEVQRFMMPPVTRLDRFKLIQVVMCYPELLDSDADMLANVKTHFFSMAMDFEEREVFRWFVPAMLDKSPFDEDTTMDILLHTLLVDTHGFALLSASGRLWRYLQTPTKQIQACAFIAFSFLFRSDGACPWVPRAGAKFPKTCETRTDLLAQVYLVCLFRRGIVQDAFVSNTDHMSTFMERAVRLQGPDRPNMRSGEQLIELYSHTVRKIHSLPFKLVVVPHMPRTAGDCAICLESWTSTDEVHVYPCRHMFHKVCVTKWNGSCPTCRTDGGMV